MLNQGKNFISYQFNHIDLSLILILEPNSRNCICYNYMSPAEHFK